MSRPLANLAALRNSTTAAFASPLVADTYWAQFEEISKYNVSLNYFERLWLAWYTYMQNDVLATGIMSFVMHETVYFGRSLPWIIIDCIPFFNKYKIQPVSALATCVAGNLADAFLGQNSDRQGAIAVRRSRAAEPLHRRASPDLAVPPHGSVLRS